MGWTAGEEIMVHEGARRDTKNIKENGQMSLDADVGWAYSPTTCRLRHKVKRWASTPTLLRDLRTCNKWGTPNDKLTLAKVYFAFDNTNDVLTHIVSDVDGGSRQQ